MKLSTYTLQEKVKDEWHDYVFSDQQDWETRVGNLSLTIGKNHQLWEGKVRNKLEELTKLKGDSFRIIQRDVEIVETVISEHHY